MEQDQRISYLTIQSGRSTARHFAVQMSLNQVEHQAYLASLRERSLLEDKEPSESGISLIERPEPSAATESQVEGARSSAAGTGQ